MNSRISIFVAGFMAVFGVYSIRQGITTKKASDVVLGIVCLLGFAAVAILEVLDVRNR